MDLFLSRKSMKRMRDDKLTNIETGIELKKLVDCRLDEVVRIVEINAGSNAKLKLMNMGIRLGQKIRIKKVSSLRGPVVVNCNASEIAIGHGLAGKILVEGI
ncbi:MAG: FeoA family protein [bacterium]